MTKTETYALQHEVLLPYMLDQQGRTFFEVHGPKLLAGPESK